LDRRIDRLSLERTDDRDACGLVSMYAADHDHPPRSG
jgi:hypothetical protein